MTPLLAYTLGILTGTLLTGAAAFFAYRTAQWHYHDVHAADELPPAPRGIPQTPPDQ